MNERAIIIKDTLLTVITHTNRKLSMQVGSKSYGQFLEDWQRFWSRKYIEIVLIFITLVELRFVIF